MLIRMLEVIVVPILYPEDEEELHHHVHLMMGRIHLNLLTVVEFSIHQLRQYVVI
jgi:hypothetical protein